MVEKLWNLKILRVPRFWRKEWKKGGNRRKKDLTGFLKGGEKVIRVPRVPLLPSSESKAFVGSYEYHFWMKGMDKRFFLVVQVVLVGSFVYQSMNVKTTLLFLSNFFLTTVVLYYFSLKVYS